MAVLVPGANAAITAENPHLESVVVGLGWSVVPSRGPQVEPVAIAIMCSASGTAISNDHLVFFNQIADPSESVQFLGDDDQEQIDVHLRHVPAEVSKISFNVYIDPDVRGLRTFSSVRNAYIRLCEPTGRELIRFNLPDNPAGNETAMVFGELYRNAGGWKFRAVGQGYAKGLQGMAQDFGISI